MTVASIILKNVYVNGVDTKARANGVKKLLCGAGKFDPTSAEIPILCGVDFEAKHGDKVAIIGRNGCGKSSLLKVISGIYPIASGHRHVVGNVAPLIEMGLGFDPDLSGLKNIKLSFAYRGKLGLYSEDLERQIIEFAELGEKINLPLKSYSSGMQARLAFSCTVFQNPDILLLDEVLAVGDQGFVEKSRKLIEQRFRDAPISIIVHHAIDQVKSLCNRFILMDGGRVISEGSCKDILQEYRTKILKI